MAPSNKKTSSASHVKKSHKKNRSSQRKPNKRSKKNGSGEKYLRNGVFVGSIVLLMGVMVGVGYCLGACWLKEDKPPVVKTYQKHETKHEKRTITHKPAKTEHKIAKKQPKEKVAQKSRYKRSKLAYRGEKPKLVIIIDDVHTSTQLGNIQRLPFPVTPSIFPPYSLDPNTPKLAAQAVHYMIHLPMESGNAKLNRQTKTLMRTFSQEQLTERMRELRRLFPRAHYINNHTGSRFTADKAAMQRFYAAMKQFGFDFIDSRTSAQSKVRDIAHAYGDDYVARDIFLDNVRSVAAIQTQLKKALKRAKKNGYAIAIGHPYKETMAALKQAKPLLKEVEVVYVDEIFREE